MARAKTDAVLAAAVEPARRELLEATKGEGVGEHVGFTLDADRLGTHWFAATLPGYRGWHWAVTVTRAHSIALRVVRSWHGSCSARFGTPLLVSTRRIQAGVSLRYRATML